MSHPEVKADMDLYRKVSELSDEKKEFVSAIIDLVRDFHE